MFLKGKNKNSSDYDKVFMEPGVETKRDLNDFEVIDLDDKQDSDIENLFKATSFDTSHPDKIIIRDIDDRKVASWHDEIIDEEDAFRPKKKVRRRVKKSSENKKRFLDILLGEDEDEEPLTEPEYIPLASELDNNRGISDFRKESANWMDRDYSAEYSGLNDVSDDNISFLDAIKSAAPLQWVAAGLAVVLFVSSIMTTSVYAKSICADRRAEAISKLKTFEASEAAEVAKVVEDVEIPISAADTEPEVKKILSLVLSSVEKDLKIKLIDDEDTLVRNLDWSVTVTDNDGASTEEEDDDRDGIIHLTDISAGDYTVELNPTSSLVDYELPASAQTVSVKAKIEYKVIANIKEEIKTEKEVNVAKEDVGNRPADVEQTTTLADTVEMLESTKTAVSDKYVEAAVDLSKTAKNTSGNKLKAFLDSFKSTKNASFGKYSTVAYPLIMANVDPAQDPGTDPAPHTEHDYSGEYVKNGNGTHSRKCTGCDAKSDPETCTFDGNTCTICGYTNEDHTHSFVYKNGEKTETTHTLICETEGATTTAEHSFDGNNTCTVCGYVKVTHTLTYTQNNNGTHNVTCSVSGCNETKTNVACEYDADNKCKQCKAPKPAATYKLTVTDASSTGTSFAAGASVTVTAAVPKGKKFLSWDAHGITLTDAQKKTSPLTFSMPASDVTIKALFDDEVKYADTAQLYDSSMNQLYVKDGDSYRLAKYADYKKNPAQKFYKKVEEFLYTGWQTIDGKRYYYNRENKPVTGDQVIGGVQYHFGTDGALSVGDGKLGIDVSKYQPSINWASVKRSGVDYAIIRCGYRGSDTGALIEDPYFRSHIKGAKAAGLKVGVYFFTTAVTEAEAVEEASMVAYLCGSYGIDYPVFMDCESSPRAGYNGMSASQRTAIIKAFCNTIRSAGYTPGVYANKTWLTSYINAGELGGYKIWLAQYNTAPTYSGRYDLWQYTSKGRVDGIPGNVDMNQSYLGY